MAKLWILSDLHLETLPYPENFRPTPPAFDVLVAAGDIQEGDPGRGFSILRRLAGDKPVVFVMGNHEHWNGIVDEDLALAGMLAAQVGITLLDGVLLLAALTATWQKMSWDLAGRVTLVDLLELAFVGLFLLDRIVRRDGRLSATATVVLGFVLLLLGVHLCGFLGLDTTQAVDLAIDVQGYTDPTALLAAVTASKLLDTLTTSTTTIDGNDWKGGKRKANSTYTLTVTNNLTLTVGGAVTATSAIGAVNWTVSIGDLPGGLTLNPTSGLISGTPTTPGPVSFTVTATDLHEVPGLAARIGFPLVVRGMEAGEQLVHSAPQAHVAAVRLGADLAAAAPYYGAPPMAADVPKIKAAMLVHHGALDTRLASGWPDYDKQLTAAGVAHASSTSRAGPSTRWPTASSAVSSSRTSPSSS